MGQFTIFVPKTFNDGRPVPQKYFDVLEDYLVKEHGGYTGRDVFGGWASETLGLLPTKELSYEYFVFGKADRKKIIRLAEIIKAAWGQSSVMVVINGKEVFV